MARPDVTHTAVGMELVRKLSESGQRLFTSAQARRLAPAAGVSAGYFRQALHHLARSGWIVRLRKGLYCLSGAVPGAAPLHEFEIAMALVEPAAISHWSALSYHGLTEQTPRRVFVLTTARAVPRPRNARTDAGYSVGSARYQFVQVTLARFFGVTDVWIGESRVKVTDPERTLLDGLMMPQYCGDFSEVLHAFEVRAPTIDVDRIVGYALRLDAATAKRLGWILERQQVDPTRLERLLRVPIKGYRVLDPSGPRRGAGDRRWMVQLNLAGNTLP